MLQLETKFGNTEWGVHLSASPIRAAITSYIRHAMPNAEKRCSSSSWKAWKRLRSPL